MTQQPLKQCPRCQQVTALDTPVCVSCGHQFSTRFVPPIQQTQMFMPLQKAALQQQPDYLPFDHLGKITVPARSHSVVAAVVLSLVCIPGAGQIYNHQPLKGVLFILLGIFCGVMFGYYAAAVWLVALADAGAIASRLCKGEPVDAFQWF